MSKIMSKTNRSPMNTYLTEHVNKVIVITGGAKGLGACIAQTFIELGALVAFCDTDTNAGEKRELALNKIAGAKRARFYPVDLSDSVQVEEFIKNVITDFESVNVLVNNAGIFSTKSMFARPLVEWDLVMAVNLRAAYMCAQLLGEHLIKSHGNIINIASTRALMSETGTEPYSASKGGLVALTHSLAISLGQNHIRVNCISPGWIDTSAWQIPRQKSKLRDIDHQQHPVGRVGKPEDIASACLFLASDTTAGFITGHNLIVDGGMTKKMIYVE